MDIVGNRNDVLKLWPLAEAPAASQKADPSNATVPKPVGVSNLVWAVTLVLDDIEKQTPTGLAGFTQGQLTAAVSARLPRGISKRTLQKALPLRSGRSGRPTA
jgi:hypothetical protein